MPVNRFRATANCPRCEKEFDLDSEPIRDGDTPEDLAAKSQRVSADLADLIGRHMDGTGYTTCPGGA